MSDSHYWGVPYPSWDYKPDPHWCQHTWVDTGSRRTWCKRCDCDGDLDPMTNTVTVVVREKEPKNIIKGNE